MTNFSLSGASITLQPVYYKTVSTAGRAELKEDEPETMVTLDEATRTICRFRYRRSLARNLTAG